MSEQGRQERRWRRLRLRDGDLPDHRAARCLLRVVGSSGRVAGGGLVLLLAAAWSLSQLAGGAGVAVPHGYYVPVLLAAVRFGRVGALVTALIAGVLAGPLTYQEVASATPQAGSEWVTRAAFFLVVGQLVAWLFAHALASVEDEAELARADRQLRDAIAAGQLSVRYQPVVRLGDGRLVGLEALVRWNHPDGERGPAVFLPTAERSGRIHQIGDLVLRTACAQAARWEADARTAGRKAPVVSVNLSTQELAAADLVARVSDVLRATGLTPDRLCLEVTEGALAQDIEGSAARLSALRDLGVRIAIDDFGSGYSSLSYVHRFPMDLLKIDRSFVHEMAVSERARTLVRGIVLLCGELGVTPVIEGIETPAQLEIAAAVGCELAQGFLLARPETAAQIDGRLRRRTPMVPAATTRARRLPGAV